MDDLFGDVVIHSYGLEQALADGLLVPVLQELWPMLTGGKPLVATDAVDAEFDQLTLLGVWQEYTRWRIDVMPTLPSEEQMFTTTRNGLTLWVLEDGAAFAILFPEDF